MRAGLRLASLGWALLWTVPAVLGAMCVYYWADVWRFPGFYAHRGTLGTLWFCGGSSFWYLASGVSGQAVALIMVAVLSRSRLASGRWEVTGAVGRDGEGNRP